MNAMPASRQRRGEGGVLGQEPVAGMDGLRAGGPAGGHDGAR